ncbi:MAG: site-2 protease family protein [Planctomycetes bacterium]|jgi:Zn-dependent protease|nr:site-2 protease family protein [Planctomycetota bacterium]
MPIEELGLGLLWYVVFVVSTTFHEAAHGFMAWRCGDPTAHRAGLVTLDPLPHIRRSPFGMVVIPLLSFFSGGWMVGWASTPYNPYWAQANRRKAAFMSLAGPAANLILVLVAGVLIHAGMLLGVFAQPEQVTWTQTTVAQSPGFATGAAVAVSILFSLNLILLVFNLLPVPPLDGSDVLSLFLNESTARRYQDLIAQPAAQMVGLIVAWRLLAVVLYPVFTTALNLLYPGAHYS